MHTEFQEIIEQFLQTAPLGLQDVKNTPIDNAPYNIQSSLISYDNHLKLYHTLLNYLDSETHLLTKSTESGQITCPNTLKDIENKIQRLDGYAEQLFELTSHLNAELSNLFDRRDFLNARSPTFGEFEHFSNSIEFNLFFLNNDYTRDFETCPSFRRLNLDKDSFDTLDLIYQSSLTPQNLLENIYKSLGLGTHNRIALCNYQPRHNGFLIYFDPADKELCKLFESIALREPESLYTLQANLAGSQGANIWVLDTTEYNFTSDELLKCFDGWIDTNWLTIYLKEALFPIHNIINPLQNTQFNNPCYLGSFFNKLDTAIYRNKGELLGAIGVLNPFWYLKKVFYWNGSNFVEINDTPFLCTHEITLIKFFNGENAEFIAYYHAVDNRFILNTNAKENQHEAALLEETYMIGLEILNNQPLLETTRLD